MDLLNKAWVEVKNNDESEVIIEFLTLWVVDGLLDTMERLREFLKDIGKDSRALAFLGLRKKKISFVSLMSDPYNKVLGIEWESGVPQWSSWKL